ncbi:MAG: hypothetical protein V9E85_08305 [Candidatus Nanopelagicales bacterium]
MIGIGANAVASYIVLVCRPRPGDAATISLSDFSRALRRELPDAIRDLQAGSILPVDLYQAALGSGDADLLALPQGRGLSRRTSARRAGRWN